MNEFEILDPTSEQEPEAWALSAPLNRRRDTRFGLLDISKPRGDLFLDELERLMRGRGYEVSRFRKPTMTRPAAAEMVSEIAQTCDAAVIALAD
ncbi:MAG: hypothetical protein GY910_13840 [bacterium]|nr:hypothetical protein [Deltaproteobacteria bacterium]MCP4906054.1 hypothetical protein [bacterium]